MEATSARSAPSVPSAPVPEETDGIPGNFTSRQDWLLAGMRQQGPAVLVALLASWTGVILALWVALFGMILGVLVALGLISTTHFTRSLFNAGAGQAVTFAGVLVGAIVGAGGSFTAFYTASLFANPERALISIGSGLLLAAGIVWAISQAEHTLLRMRGYRRLSRDEVRRIAPLVAQAATEYRLTQLPRFAMADLQIPQAWTHTRTIVLTTGILDMLDDAELRAVIAHELAHWMRCDAVGLSIVWACAWPIAVTYNLGVWLSGRDLNAEKQTARAPRGVIGWIGWLFLWPSWLITNVVIAPIVAARTRRHEYTADADAKRIGYGPALSSALLKLSAFEAGRTGWEYAMTRSHPPMELRREALAPALPDDDQFQQQELGMLPRAVLENAAIVAVVALIVGGAWINSNRASSSTAASPPAAHSPSSQTVDTVPGVTPATNGSRSGNAVPTTVPQLPSFTAGFPRTHAGASDAAARFATALTESLWIGNTYASVIRSSAGPGAYNGLVHEVQPTVASLHGQQPPSSAAALTRELLTDYQPDSGGQDLAFITLDFKEGTVGVHERVILAWFPDGWHVTDISEITLT